MSNRLSSVCVRAFNHLTAAKDTGTRESGISKIPAEFLNSPREFPGISKIQFYLGNDYTAERPYICKYYTAERPYNICILRGRSAV